DRLHRVDRDRRVGNQGAARLEQQALPGAEVLVRRTDDRVHILDRIRSDLLRRVRNAEPAAEVVDTEVAQIGDRADRATERLHVQQLRADVEVQPDELEMRGGLCA